MLSPTLVVTPSHACRAELALAAARAGETGILDLGYTADQAARQAAIGQLARHVSSSARWGIRWDTLGRPTRAPACLAALLAGQSCPVLVLGGAAAPQPVAELLRQSRPIASRVLLEVTCLEQALVAQEVGFDGVIVKGHEAGGQVGDESTFLLLQRLHGRLRLPYWVQGGIGPDTAAAAFLAGAAGIVLCEQVWLATESPLDRIEQQRWSRLDGSEAVCLGEDGWQFRFYSAPGSPLARALEEARVAGGPWRPQVCEWLLAGGGDLAKTPVALGQDVAFARRLAEQHRNVAGILAAYRRQVKDNLATAARARALGPDAPLARAHDTRYPVLQGPMTRVSDTAPFSRAVADSGALPFSALALMTGSETRRLLEDTKALLGDRPWGVGILGFVPLELRNVQLEVIRDLRPPCAIIAGGRAGQARDLEALGIATYLHVPSAGLLESFLADGARKLIFEGRECGGHVGPRTSFCLWQAAIDMLLTAEVAQAEQLHIIFAGGIHDGLSAAMVAATAARLTARGMKIGVLMGTAYLFTHEAVGCGAITAEFQRQALGCAETVLLDSGFGHAIRCVRTPFADEFNAVRSQLVRAGKCPEEVRRELDVLNLGRLRLASKGLARQLDPRQPEAKGDLVAVDYEAQRRGGMYMIGQVAGLRDAALSLADLHEQVCQGCVTVLDKIASQPLPWLENTVADPRPSRDIAIVGMACIFPKAKDLRTYWQNICNRLDAIEEVPPDRWRAEDFYSPDRQARDRTYSKWGGFIGKRIFNPVKWRIPPASLPSIEPIQLLSLEVAAHALADAGYDLRDFPRERTGVIFGVAPSHDVVCAYSFRTLLRHYLPRVEGLPEQTRNQIWAKLAGQLPEWTEDSFPGFLTNVVAGRIARELNLNGPNYTVDAACASSLAALHAAVEQLRAGTSDMMLVGGADGTNNIFSYVSFAKTNALSPRGRSRPFDESADGIALGEGVACLVLKRLDDAQRDGDRVYAVLKGLGASSDGKNRSLTAPHPAGQARALERAYADARVSPATVTLIEAHGTGTAVGDSAEWATLTAVFRPQATERHFAAVGSVKSMIGHTRVTAGLAGLIKTALALQQRVLPPTIGVEKPGKGMEAPDSPLYLNTETRPWLEERTGRPRRAGVSAFGFGGTNFHVVLEEYPRAVPPVGEQTWAPRPAEVIAWARAGREDIVRDLSRLEQQLTTTVSDDLPALAFAASAEESARNSTSRRCRLGLVAYSVEDLQHKVRTALARLAERTEQNDPRGIYYAEAPAIDGRAVCFLYPGQGSQVPNMLRDLVVGAPWAHDLFTEANRILAHSLPQPLTRYVYPPPAIAEAARQEQAAALNDTRIAQPALGVIGLFATEFLERFGIRPGMLAGHSFGEILALHVAGCLSREELLSLAALRGRACAEAAAAAPGGMAVVWGGTDAVRLALQKLDIPAVLANCNAPSQTVLAGSEAVIQAAVEQLPALGLKARRLPVSAAFHTPALQPAADALAAHLATGCALQAPRLPVYSNTTAGPYPHDPGAIQHVLARHVTEPVLFEQEVRRLYADGARVFMEVGPGKVLTDLVADILRGEPVTTLAVDVPGREGWTQLAHVIARAFALGLPVCPEAWFDGRGLAVTTLAQHFDNARAASRPTPTDWLIDCARIEPVTAGPMPKAAPLPAAPTEAGPPSAHLPSPDAGSARERAPAAAIRPGSAHRSTEGEPASYPPAISTPQTTGPLMTNPTTDLAASVPAPPATAAGTDLFTQLQSMTVQFLHWQEAQQRVAERFLAAQEKLLQLCTQGTVPAPAQAALPVPPVVEPARPMGLGAAVRPAPASVKPPVPIPEANTRQSARTAGVATAHPVARAAQAGPAVALADGSGPAAQNRRNGQNGADLVQPVKVAPSGAHGLPPLEVFRQDLLQIVSERTGYPIDMLDEDLPLEAGLGIDSIKTLEIFNKLKTYHACFQRPDQEEEDFLAEFTKLKTLRDIVSFYARQRDSFPTAGAGSAGEPMRDAGGVSDATVQRYAVTPVAAPPPGNDEKKNSLSTSSS
jgi:acyl transferase domain-containing protein/NAD(P)H-dependent flavin oxidoreductase YrpB (nitropropane dioxygenase family)